MTLKHKNNIVTCYYTKLIFLKNWNEVFAMLPRLTSNLRFSCLSLLSSWDHSRMPSRLPKRVIFVKWIHTKRVQGWQTSSQTRVKSEVPKVAPELWLSQYSSTWHNWLIGGLDKRRPVKLGTGGKKLKPLFSEGFQEGWEALYQLGRDTVFIWPLITEPTVYKNYKSLKIHLEL